MQPPERLRTVAPARVLVAAVAAVLVLVLAEPAHAEPAYGSYSWPVRGAVVQAYQDLPSPYVAGHRGLDVAAAPGTPVLTMAPGTVAFAGKIGGSLFISVDHPDGVRTTFSWVSRVDVKKGQAVRTGEQLGLSGSGHPTGEVPVPHLHVGARYGGAYFDPMLLLTGVDVVDLIQLAQLVA